LEVVPICGRKNVLASAFFLQGVTADGGFKIEYDVISSNFTLFLSPYLHDIIETRSLSTTLIYQASIIMIKACSGCQSPTLTISLLISAISEKESVYYESTFHSGAIRAFRTGKPKGQVAAIICSIKK